MVTLDETKLKFSSKMRYLRVILEKKYTYILKTISHNYAINWQVDYQN